MTAEYIVCFITADTREEAERIAETLVSEKLAACCTMQEIRSIYRWKGELCRAPETMLIAKTQRHLFDALRDRARALHSYEVPEIIALPIVDGYAPYLDWIAGETTE